LVDRGHKRQPDGNLEKIADQLRVDLDNLADVIDNWSKDDFLKHCAKLSAAELKPPAMRRGAPGAAPPARSPLTPDQSPTVCRQS
jgi:hypothetical protein